MDGCMTMLALQLTGAPYIVRAGLRCVTAACAAQEATRALVPLLGDYYAKDTRNVFAAMYQDWIKTRYVSPDARGEGVLWYRRF